jgi:hypothetical protein
MKKLIASLLFVPCMASAEFMDGNGLLSKMNDVEFLPKMVALGYVQGVADVYHGTKVCMSKNVTAGQAAWSLGQEVAVSGNASIGGAGAVMLGAGTGNAGATFNVTSGGWLNVGANLINSSNNTLYNAQSSAKTCSL